MFRIGDSLSPAMTAGEERMETPEDVAVMLRLAELGWGSKRIAGKLGCSRTTVKRYLRQGGWASYRGRGRPSALAGLEGWLAERFRQHRGNADVVRQELDREHGVRVSLRTVEHVTVNAGGQAIVHFHVPAPTVHRRPANQVPFLGAERHPRSDRGSNPSGRRKNVGVLVDLLRNRTIVIDAHDAVTLVL